MTLEELIAAARLEVDDNAANNTRVSDDVFTRFANEAQIEACRRARLLQDASTAAICQIAYAANAVSADLDPRVILIRRPMWAGRSVPLKRKLVREMDRERAGWESDTDSEPIAIVTDWQTGKLRPYPTPTVSGTINLIVIREPLDPMTQGIDEPEIPGRYHEGLVHWMRHRYFSLPDSQINDPKASLEALALFEAEFGTKSSARDEVYIEREYDQDWEAGVY
jgi:hypothetical protein